jgi:glycosyltransferase A (GT-A) superfamily protein (DUF2064 family)
MKTSRPSLLVFTLDPARDCARQRLMPAGFESLERVLRQRSLEAALDAGAATGCSLEVSSPLPLDLGERAHWAPQRGGSFGERFRQALRGAYERSNGPLVVVGSDVPGLGREHLAAALERLGAEPDRVVLGPSPDGGFYLLAANRPLDAELGEVRWCRRDTLRSLIAALRSSGLEVCLIAPLEDLDRPQDLFAWLASGAAARQARWQRFTQLLLRLLTALSRPLTIATLGAPRAALALPATGRAPPR